MIVVARRLVLILGALLLAGAPVHAQQAKRPPYVRLEFDPDLEQSLRRQLQAAELWKLLLDDFKKHPEKYKLPDGKPKLDLQDPRWRERVKDWLDSNPTIKKPDPDLLKEIRKNIVENPAVNPPDIDPGSASPLPPLPHMGEVPAVREPSLKPVQPPEQGTDWLREFMDRVEHSPLGEKLGKSEAWQASRINLQRLPLGDHGPKFLDPERVKGLGERLRGLLDKPLSLPELPRAGWANLRPPALSSWPRPNLNLDRLPSLGAAPPVGGSGPPSASIWLQAGQTLLILCLVILAAKLLWRLAIQSFFGRHQGDSVDAGLGPWPLDPRQLSTPAELVRAFDYLALLLLGQPARFWHHRAVAEGLGAASGDRRRAAQNLSRLYEQARYAPDAARLTPDELTMARRDLCFLAGVGQA